ncbi:Folliculin-interacting protein 1 [Stylophora pistillata]|uniref:Folliculin-interacting protein 1 n=1 Tax=Stylophora pistillata TaxID=50429 RepID=A0A2B4RG02_STYPI|nr:Folliculin-interacting protein 1 [Stylophora pistillata]
MLSKIFSFGARKPGKKHSDGELDTPDEILATKRPFPQLEHDEIRILVFKECDRKGKTLLFDSKAVPKSDSQQDAGQNRISDSDKRLSGGPRLEQKGSRSPTQKSKLQYARQSHDSKMLGEMIFGSVAMTYKGQTVKVHEIRTPHQLLLTNVFAVQPRIVLPSCGDSSDYFSTSSSHVDSGIGDSSNRHDLGCGSLSSQNSLSKLEDSVLGPSSKPMAVPGSSPVVAIDADEDSGFTASVDSNTSLGFNSASSPCGSYQRRLRRSHVTSIDNSFGRKSEELPEVISPPVGRRPKLGIGILFTLGDNEEKSRALQGVFFAHFPLFELHVMKLRVSIENACFGKPRLFTSQVIEAVNTFRNTIHNMFATPRLKEPVWLNMMTHSSHRPQLCDKFMVELVDCLKVGNSRETNFFMAAILTAVLQNHLAWVSTVMPAGTAPSRAFLDKHSSKTLDLLAQSHPYNPLWAQLGDLYGAVGFPLRVTRTVVVGKDSKIVSKVLNILSYFIRCTEVFEHVQRRDDEDNDDTKENLSCFGQESVQTVCSQCGSKSVSEVENSGKSFTEPSVCLQYKENSEGSCALHDKLKDKEKKEILREQLLSQLQGTNGFTHCLHCNARISDVNTREKLTGMEILQSVCTCNKISNGGVHKELKHFVKDSSLLALANNHCNSFQCYCCKNASEKGSIAPKGRKIKCYCGLEVDSDKSCGKQECVRCSAQCLEKLQSSQNGKSHHLTETNNCLTTKILQAVQRRDSVGNCNENVGRRISEADSCVSEDRDSLSLRNSVLEKCTDVEETIASYGRSGSADSGIHQSPLNSPSIKKPESFPSVVPCQLEDEQMPEEIPLPRTEEVSSSSNSKSDDWKIFNNFGRSMFAGIVDSYLPDLVLQGVQENDFRGRLSADLKLALQHSVVDDPVSEAVCIIANTDKCDPIYHEQQVEVSNLVLSMLSSVSGLWDIKMSAEFCLMHLEDKLKEIYLKSKVITERYRERRKLFRSDITNMLSVDDNDVPLLLAVASTHAPQSMTLVG